MLGRRRTRGAGPAAHLFVTAPRDVGFQCQVNTITAAEMPLLPSLIRVGVFLLALATSAASASAQNEMPREGGSEDSRLELRLSLLSRVLPSGSTPAVGAGIDYAQPTNGASRLIGGIAYSLQIAPTGECCGPNPGFTYQEHALTIGVGAETVLRTAKDFELTADLRYEPTMYHTLRHGSQDDFEPSPTTWRFFPWLFSTALAGRKPISDSVLGSVGGRARFSVADLGWGALRPGLELSMGFSRR